MENLLKLEKIKKKNKVRKENAKAAQFDVS